MAQKKKVATLVFWARSDSWTTVEGPFYGKSVDDGLMTVLFDGGATSYTFPVEKLISLKVEESK